MFIKFNSSFEHRGDEGARAGSTGQPRRALQSRCPLRTHNRQSATISFPDLFAGTEKFPSLRRPAESRVTRKRGGGKQLFRDVKTTVSLVLPFVIRRLQNRLFRF